MGRSYGMNYATGRWSMDCGKCGKLGASRMRCPINYCYPAQLCSECAKATGWRRKATHAKCYESHARDERERIEFLIENGKKWVAVVAWGDWAEWVPQGMTGVACYRGGNQAGRSGECAYFLVSADEYRAQGQHNFVIDEARHYRFESDPTSLTSKEVVAA